MKKILVVDDNSNNRYVLKNLLEEKYEVTEAENGDDALEKAHKEPPDLIISDILMPIMDGYILCRHCKSDARLKRTSFVFYSAAYTGPKDEKFALSLGADRFILKPQKAETIIKIVQELLVEEPTLTHPSIKPLGEEMECFRKYDEVLFRKLEKEMLDLETTNHRLELMEERYRLIYENVSDVIMMFDPDLNLISVSPSVETVLGYEPKELIGRPLPDIGKLLTPNSFKQTKIDLRPLFKGEKFKVTILEFVSKDGTIKICEVNGSPVMNNGDMVCLVSIARDITERRRTEEALHQAQTAYQSIFENTQEGIYRSTPEGRFILANRAMARILGYDSPEELIADITDITRQLYVNAEERARVISIIEQQNLIKNKEVQFRRKDGRMIWVSRTMHTVRDEKGMTLYYEGLIEDITERKQSIDRIRKTLGATVQAIVSVVEIRDPYTAGHQRRVAEIARTIATEMEISPDRIDGLRIASTIHDIGKISVPFEILSKPSKLTDIEFALIKTHAQSGHNILKDIDFPWPIARMVLEHHERMNGSGYPNGLTGDNILLESRILTVADVVEAIASHRPYRPALGIEAALEEITQNRGVLYDPEVVDACLRLFRNKGYRLIINEP